MEKENYEKCEFKVIFFEESDVITGSPEYDDFETPLT